MRLQSWFRTDALPGREPEWVSWPDSVAHIIATSHCHLPIRALCRFITSRILVKITTAMAAWDNTDKRHATAFILPESVSHTPKRDLIAASG